MSTLHQLAVEAGLQDRWTAADGERHEVNDDTLRAVLAALDLPAGNEDEIWFDPDAVVVLDGVPKVFKPAPVFADTTLYPGSASRLTQASLSSARAVS